MNCFSDTRCKRSWCVHFEIPFVTFFSSTRPFKLSSCVWTLINKNKYKFRDCACHISIHSGRIVEMFQESVFLFVFFLLTFCQAKPQAFFGKGPVFQEEIPLTSTHARTHTHTQQYTQYSKHQVPVLRRNEKKCWNSETRYIQPFDRNKQWGRRGEFQKWSTCFARLHASKFTAALHNLFVF